jgi:hypothetical protein
MALLPSTAGESMSRHPDRDGAGASTPACLSETDRRLLLSTPGISVGVVARLEAAGVHSLAQLQGERLDMLLADICRQMGNAAFLNRRRALRGAVARAKSACGGTSTSGMPRPGR